MCCWCLVLKMMPFCAAKNGCFPGSHSNSTFGMYQCLSGSCVFSCITDVSLQRLIVCWPSTPLLCLSKLFKLSLSGAGEQHKVLTLLQVLERVHAWQESLPVPCQVVFMPAVRDAFHHPTFPQPPINLMAHDQVRATHMTGVSIGCVAFCGPATHATCPCLRG